MNKVGLPRKEREAFDINTKIKVIKQLKWGKKVNVIMSDLKLSHTTVSTILKNKEKICEAVKCSAIVQSIYIWGRDQKCP